MKALVIGLDGATYRVLNPLMAAGVMPHLQRLVQAGVAADLLSTVPPITALAWPSFMTGNSPGRHGLLSWQGPLNEQFERPWATAAQIHGTKLWDGAGEAGLRVVVYNVPVTFPPTPVNGALVGGLLTPGIDSEFTYPAALREALLAAFPEYCIDIDLQHTERDAHTEAQIRTFLDETRLVTAQRGAALRWLIEREQPDLVVGVFETTDRLQHVLWKYIAALPDRHMKLPFADLVQKELLNVFTTLDDEIGKLAALAGEQTTIALLSDHGFGPIDTMVHLNHWLAQQGFLRFDVQRAGRRELLRRVGRLVKRWLPGRFMRRARASFSPLRTLDWSATRAYAGLPSECGIFINMAGREPAGSVAASDYEATRDAILDALARWTDPRTGQPVVRAAHRREDLYAGPFVSRAPDIVLEFMPGYHVAHLPYRGEILMDVSHMPIGFHEPEGIFALSGPGVRVGERLPAARIEDVMPTLLYALGLAVPQGLDGRPLLEAFTSEHRERNPLRFREDLPGDTPAAEPRLSAAENEQIAARLRGLGYLQ